MGKEEATQGRESEAREFNPKSTRMKGGAGRTGTGTTEGWFLQFFIYARNNAFSKCLFHAEILKRIPLFVCGASSLFTLEP